MSREVDRVATRKSLVFILRMNQDGLLCTSCVQYARLEKLSSLFLAVQSSRNPHHVFFGSWWDIRRRECGQTRLAETLSEFRAVSRGPEEVASIPNARIRIANSVRLSLKIQAGGTMNLVPS